MKTPTLFEYLSGKDFGFTLEKDVPSFELFDWFFYWLTFGVISVLFFMSGVALYAFTGAFLFIWGMLVMQPLFTLAKTIHHYLVMKMVEDNVRINYPDQGEAEPFPSYWQYVSGQKAVQGHMIPVATILFWGLMILVAPFQLMKLLERFKPHTTPQLFGTWFLWTLFFFSCYWLFVRFFNAEKIVTASDLEREKIRVEAEKVLQQAEAEDVKKYETLGRKKG